MRNLRAEKLYFLILDLSFMDKAAAKFPQYSFKQSKEATEYVLQLVYENLLDSYEKENWDKSELKKELFLMIHGGLT